MYQAVVRAIVPVLVLAAMAGCAASGAPPGGPGSVATYLHGQGVVTFSNLPR